MGVYGMFLLFVFSMLPARKKIIQIIMFLLRVYMSMATILSHRPTLHYLRLCDGVCLYQKPEHRLIHIQVWLAESNRLETKLIGQWLDVWAF